MRFVSLIVGILFLFCASAVAAQDRGSMVLQGLLGAREGILESPCAGGAQQSVGASFHYYVSERTSLGPEFLWLFSCDQTFTYYAPRMSGTLQITHDLSSRRVRPYVIAGVGLMYHQSKFAPAEAKLEAAGGGGLKVFANDRVFIAPEARFGSGGNGTIRYGVNVGILLR